MVIQKHRDIKSYTKIYEVKDADEETLGREIFTLEESTVETICIIFPDNDAIILGKETCIKSWAKPMLLRDLDYGGLWLYKGKLYCVEFENPVYLILESSKSPKLIRIEDEYQIWLFKDVEYKLASDTIYSDKEMCKLIYKHCPAVKL